MEEYLIIKQNGTTENIKYSEAEKYNIYARLRSELHFAKSFLFQKNGPTEMENWNARLDIPSDYTLQQEEIVKNILCLAPSMKSFQSVSNDLVYPWKNTTSFQPSYISLETYLLNNLKEMINTISLLIMFKNNLETPYVGATISEKPTKKLYAEILTSLFGNFQSKNITEWLTYLTNAGNFLWLKNFQDPTKLDLFLPQKLTFSQRSFLFATLEATNSLYSRIYLNNQNKLQPILNNPTNMEIVSTISFSSEPNEILTLKQK